MSLRNSSVLWTLFLWSVRQRRVSIFWEELKSSTCVPGYGGTIPHKQHLQYVWYSNLQRVVKTAQRIISIQLPTTEAIYMPNVQKELSKIPLTPNIDYSPNWSQNVNHFTTALSLSVYTALLYPLCIFALWITYHCTTAYFIHIYSASYRHLYSR